MGGIASLFSRCCPYGAYKHEKAYDFHSASSQTAILHPEINATFSDDALGHGVSFDSGNSVDVAVLPTPCNKGIANSTSQTHSSGFGGSDTLDFQYTEMMDLKTSISEDGSLYQNLGIGLHIMDEQKIRRCFRLLKEEIDPCSVCDYMIKYECFNEDDAEEIRKAFPRTKAVTLLLLKLFRLPDYAYLSFVHSLENTGYDYVVSTLEANTPDPDISGIPEYTNSECLCLLNINKPILLHSLDANKILDFFIENNTFSIDEYEVIFRKPSRMEQVSCLMEQIRKKVPRSFHTLLYALRETGSHAVYAYLTENNSGSRIFENKTVPDDNEIIGLKVKMTFTRQHQPFAEIEYNIKAQANSEEGQALINKHLNNITSVLEDIRDGSIIFVIKPTDCLTVKDLKTFSLNGGFKELIKSLVKCQHGQAADANLCVDLAVNVEFKETVGVRGTGLKAVVLDNKEMLVEELDAFTLIHHFTERDFFSTEERELIISSNPKTRRGRTIRFLDNILENKAYDTGLEILMDALKKSGKGYVAELLQPKHLEKGENEDLGENSDVFLIAERFSFMPEDAYNGKNVYHCSISNCEDENHTGLQPQDTQTLQQTMLEDADLQDIRMRCHNQEKQKELVVENVSTGATSFSTQLTIGTFNKNLRFSRNSNMSNTSEADSGYPGSIGSTTDKEQLVGGQYSGT